MGNKKRDEHLRLTGGRDSSRFRIGLLSIELAVNYHSNREHLSGNVPNQIRLTQCSRHEPGFCAKEKRLSDALMFHTLRRRAALDDRVNRANRSPLGTAWERRFRIAFSRTRIG